MARTTPTKVPAAREDETDQKTETTAPLPAEYAGTDTRTAEGNYATRSNIVSPDGN